MKRIGILGAALFAASALWADDPGIALHRVQQRYPWNGKVDIDYTVSNVVAGTEANYYVRFKITENGNQHVLHEFLDDSTLKDGSNGTYRVTWNSSLEDKSYRFFTKTASVQADLVYCGADKSNYPYWDRYEIIDLTAGTNEAATVAETYPVTVVYCTYDVATNTFNTSEYKTNKLVLRRIKAGTFTMGSPEGETGRESETYMNKETQHPVTLTKDYTFGIFPVTQAQYEKVWGTNPSFETQTADGNPVAERPVEMVSYQTLRGSSLTGGCEPDAAFGNFDADSFMEKISRRTGLTFDLPTEAQWEYACRAGTTNCTYIGEYTTDVNVLGTICWFGPNSGSITHGVGQLQPNAWGLYDTLGNVWEWCRDRVTPATSTTKDDFGSSAVTDPCSHGTKVNVTIRGGSWMHSATVTRAACRAGNSAVSGASRNVGIRLSRTLP